MRRLAPDACSLRRRIESGTAAEPYYQPLENAVRCKTEDGPWNVADRNHCRRCGRPISVTSSTTDPKRRPALLNWTDLRWCSITAAPSET